MGLISELFGRGVIQGAQPAVRTVADAGEKAGLAAIAGDTLAISPDALRAARQDAEQLWYYEPEKAARGDDYRQVERDAIDVNTPFGPERTARTQAAIAQNAALETQALQTLTPAARAQYQGIATVVASDAPARLALQMLLLEGKLGAKALGGHGETLLDSLSQMASGPVHAALDRAALTADAVQEVALPEAIDQCNRSTCPTAAAEVYMAKNYPAEYARVVAGLATPEGKVQLVGGSLATRTPGTELADDTGRSVPARLWNPAMMNAAAPNMAYDNAKDAFANGQTGLYDNQFNRLLTQLTGHDFAQRDASAGAKWWTLHKIKQATSRQGLVPTHLNWGHRTNGAWAGGHMVDVSSVQDGRVYYTNPWGQEESMTKREFKKRMVATQPDQQAAG